MSTKYSNLSQKLLPSIQKTNEHVEIMIKCIINNDIKEIAKMNELDVGKEIVNMTNISEDFISRQYEQFDMIKQPIHSLLESMSEHLVSIGLLKDPLQICEALLYLSGLASTLLIHISRAPYLRLRCQYEICLHEIKEWKEKKEDPEQFKVLIQRIVEIPSLFSIFVDVTEQQKKKIEEVQQLFIKDLNTQIGIIEKRMEKNGKLLSCVDSLENAMKQMMICFNSIEKEVTENIEEFVKEREAYNEQFESMKKYYEMNVNPSSISKSTQSATRTKSNEKKEKKEMKSTKKENNKEKKEVKEIKEETLTQEDEKKEEDDDEVIDEKDYQETMKKCENIIKRLNGEHVEDDEDKQYEEQMKKSKQNAIFALIFIIFTIVAFYFGRK